MKEWLELQIKNCDFHISGRPDKDFTTGYYCGLKQGYQNVLTQIKIEPDKSKQLEELDKIFPDQFGLQLRIYQIFAGGSNV